MDNHHHLDAVPRLGALDHLGLAARVATDPGQVGVSGAGVWLGERRFLAKLSLRGDAGSADFMEAAARELGGFHPRVIPNTAVRTIGFDLLWLGPDEWLVVVPGGREFDTERRLRECLSGHFAVMNVSGAQTVLELSGPAARAVLMKSTPYDVHPRNFPVGKGVSSVFAKSGAVIRRVAEERWELVIRRSFADYLFRWVLDASEEFGLHVVQ